MKTSNVSTPRIETITVYILTDKETNTVITACLDRLVAQRKAANKYNILPISMNADSDYYFIRNLKGEINKDLPF